MTDTDRSHETTAALAEVRTVLGRAKTARDKLDNGWTTYTHRTGRSSTQHDPEVDDMRAALDRVVELLSRWERRR